MFDCILLGSTGTAGTTRAQGWDCIYLLLNKLLPHGTSSYWTDWWVLPVALQQSRRCKGAHTACDVGLDEVSMYVLHW
jgi:hypothetical protein